MSEGNRVDSGTLNRNPLLGLGLGVLIAVVSTSTALGGLIMGLASACVLVCVTLFAALVLPHISENGRWPVLIVLSALFVSLARVAMKVLVPAVEHDLAVYIPGIVFSGLILCESSRASQQGSVAKALLTGVRLGVGYALILTVIGIFRELIGNGTVFSFRLFSTSYEPVLLLLLPAGGFMTVGIFIGVYRAIFPNSMREGEEGSK